MTAADLTGYRLVHRSLAHGIHRLAQGALELDPEDRRQVRAFARYWQGYAGELLHHHRVEDVIVFPELEAHVPAAGVALAAVDGDHEQVDLLLDDISAEMARVTRGRGPSRLAIVLDELRDHLDQHLEAEDRGILPLIERHVSAVQYAALEARIHDELSLGRQALFTLPFMEAHATEEEVATLLAEAPAPMRIVLRLARRGYERTCATAFPRTPVPSVGGPVRQLLGAVA